MQTVASSAEELSASVQEIARQVDQSSKIAGQAVVEADHTNETVEGLDRSAQRIGEVVQLIEMIAGQTQSAGEFSKNSKFIQYFMESVADSYPLNTHKLLGFAGYDREQLGTF